MSENDELDTRSPQQKAADTKRENEERKMAELKTAMFAEVVAEVTAKVTEQITEKLRAEFAGASTEDRDAAKKKAKAAKKLLTDAAEAIIKPMKVMALKLGEYNFKRRTPGEVFTIKNPAAFSEKWMKRMPANTPEGRRPLPKTKTAEPAGKVDISRKERNWGPAVDDE